MRPVSKQPSTELENAVGIPTKNQVQEGKISIRKREKKNYYTSREDAFNSTGRSSSERSAPQKFPHQKPEASSSMIQLAEPTDQIIQNIRVRQNRAFSVEKLQT